MQLSRSNKSGIADYRTFFFPSRDRSERYVVFRVISKSVAHATLNQIYNYPSRLKIRDYAM